MIKVTVRQQDILKAIIDEFIETAEEVGSSSLVDKYELGVSSATVRNEMVKLMEKGLLAKSHISSGRVPTDQALRYYIRELVEEKVVKSLDVVQIRQGLFKVRFDQNKLIGEILNILTEQSNAASFVILGDSSRYHGVSLLMRQHELRDIEVMQRVLDVLEDENLLKNILEKYSADEIVLLIGSETGIQDFNSCSIVYSKLNLWNGQQAYLGILGSRRINYSRVIPIMKIVRESIEESLKGWN